MTIFQYIILLGIIFLVFEFIWNYLITLPLSFLMVILSIKKKFGIYIFKIINYYLIISLTAILTLTAINSRENIGSSILFAAVGVFIIWFAFSQSIYQNRKKAAISFEYDVLEAMHYEDIFLVGSITLFIIALFIPLIVVNPITTGLLKLINWSYDLPIVGLILSIGGLLFLLNMIFYGILGSGTVLYILFNKIIRIINPKK